jgi:hypothetical protein
VTYRLRSIPDCPFQLFSISCQVLNRLLFVERFDLFDNVLSDTPDKLVIPVYIATGEGGNSFAGKEARKPAPVFGISLLVLSF